MWLLLTVSAPSLSWRSWAGRRWPCIAQEVILAVTPVPGTRASWCQPQQPWTHNWIISSDPPNSSLLFNHWSGSSRKVFEWIWEDLAAARYVGGVKRSFKMMRKSGSHYLDPAFWMAIGRHRKSYLIFIFVNLSYHVNQPALRVISSWVPPKGIQHISHQPSSLYCNTLFP